MRCDDDDLYEKPNVVIMPDKDTGGLYIGCLYIAGALADRETYGHIGAIVRIGVEPYPGYPSLLPDIQYHCINIDDHDRCDIMDHFDSCIAFINKHRKQGISVYVHCAAGVSRSATIVIAYLMKEYKLGYESAFRKLKLCRPIIDPNNGFRKQLKEFQKKCM